MTMESVCLVPRDGTDLLDRQSDSGDLFLVSVVSALNYPSCCNQDALCGGWPFPQGHATNSCLMQMTKLSF